MKVSTGARWLAALLPVMALSGSQGVAIGALPDGRPLPQGSAPLSLDPADFGGPIDNPYWPMTPGTRWVFRERDMEGGDRMVEVTVTDQTKDILGITAIVVHDLVTEDGEAVEDTLDWYAQDRVGNVWYLGEDTREYDKGVVVTTEGSWQAGVDGALAGVAMPADPVTGLTYRQEYLQGQAEDGALVLSIGETVTVPLGTYDGLLMTRDFTTLDPEILEIKFFAKGVGPVLEVGVSGGTDRAELTGFTPGS